MRKNRFKTLLACFMALLMLINTAPVYVMAETEPEKWYTRSELTIDEHYVFGENKMHTDGKENRGFENLIDNNTATTFYVTTADTAVNYQNLTGKEISITVHMETPVVIDHFKIVSGADTFKANYAHRSPTKWNLKAGNSLASCDTVLAADLPVNATVADEVNLYKLNNTTAYKYYKFTITALAGAGKSGHDSPFSNPTATCLLKDIAFGGPEPITHTDHDNITFTKWNSSDSLPSSAGNYFLDKDVTVSGTWNVPSGTTNLCLNGHSITYSGGTGSVFTIGSGATLNLHDCSDIERYYYIDSNYRGVVVGSKTEAQNGNADRNGSFTGGYITGGKGAYTDNDYRGGAVFVNGGTINMFGGTFIGNKPKANCGAIYIRVGNVAIHGGAIIGNACSGEGGGVLVQGQGNLVMDGGLIADNTAIDSHGGGIAVVGNANITGGKITGNLATGGGSNGGGGVSSVAEPGKLKIGGDVEISGNRAMGYGGGVYAGGWGWISGAVSISGSPIITGNEAKHAENSYVNDNLYLPRAVNAYYADGKALTLSGELTQGAQIGISVDTTGVFLKNWSDKMDGKQPADYFTSDNKDYDVLLNSSEEAIIGVGPVASVAKGENENLYTDFNEAFTAWKANSGSTLKLIKDVQLTVNPGFFYDAGEWTLDLNGKTLKINSTNFISASGEEGNGKGQGAIINIDDTSSDGNGKIDGNNTLTDENLLYVNNGGTLNLKKGTITNFNQSWGTILVKENGTVNMYDGFTISGNKSNTNGGGGAVSVSADGTLNMYGGVIENNTATGYKGGALRISGDTAEANIFGGTIQNNSADIGGGIAFTGGTLNIKGKVNISGNTGSNLYIGEGKTINIDGALDNETSIGITLENGSGKFTNGLDGNGTEDNFTSDNSAYGVVMFKGEALVGNYVATVANGNDEEIYSSMSDALGNWTAGSTLKLLNNVSISSTITVSGTKTLDLNGHGIRRTGTGGVIKVNEQSTLNLKDSDTSKEHKYKIASPAGNGAGVATVDDTLTSGYKTFKGGYITGGYITGGYNYGAGINVEGNGATLNMYGGTIIGNRLTAGSTGGGGVCLQDWDKSGGFNMYGGSIIGNTSNYGGGVYVRCGKTVMYDGEISNNVAHSNNIGGAVLAFGDKSTFIMEGGTINGNLAQHGGAIEASGGATVSIFGGTITNNTANGKGGALTNQRSDGDTSPAVFNISGAPVFSGNTAGGKSSDVYLCNTAVLNVTDEMTNTTPILVSRSNGSGTFTSGWKDKMGEANVDDYFTSANADYVIKKNSSGELETVYPDLPDVSAEDFEGDYDGQEHGITVSAPEGATIKYGTEEGSCTLDKSPVYTNAGTYTVYYQASKDKFTSVSGSAEITINPIDVTVTITGHNTTVDYNGNAHSADGYDAVASSALYDVENDFTFSGRAQAVRTDAGTTQMNLDSADFENTNSNFATVTFNVTDGYVEVKPIDVTVTITGHTTTVDYNGNAHSADGYDAVASNALYDVSSDFTYSGRAQAVRTDAGTTQMNLDSSKFENTNSNFANVTFNIANDGFVTVNPIDVTVTITGHNETLGYNDTVQSVTGYDAQAGSALYDVDNDFTFSGSAVAERCDVGETKMGLEASQFENINPNFATVTFNITDGYIVITKVDAVIIKKPQRRSVVYSGSKQTLITAGSVKGGTLYYAMGKDDKTAPENSKFKTELPSAKDIGNYYVWYKVEADSNHNSLSPVCVKATVADKGWVTVSGTVSDKDGKPLSGAEIVLMSGSKTVDTVTANEDGEYYFTVPAGVYNIVTTYNDKSETSSIELYKNKEQDISMLGGKTESVVKINSNDGDFGVVVGGLNEEAKAIRSADKLKDSQSLSVKMTVEAKPGETADYSKAFTNLSVNTTFMFFDVQLEKVVDSKKTVLKTSSNVLEIAVPYENINRKDLAVYFCNGSKVEKFRESDSKKNGTYRIDRKNGIIYIYTTNFATFAIGYTPYFTLDSDVILGSFKGNVNISLEGMGGEGVYRLENVTLDNVGFANVPKGRYRMTVTWTDGVQNTLTMPITVS